MLCDQDNDHMCNVVTFVLIASNTHHNQIYYTFRWIELSYQLPKRRVCLCLLLTAGSTWLEYNVQSSGKTSNTCKQQKFYLISLKKTLQLYRFYCFMHLWFFIDKNSNYKSGGTIKNQLLGKMQVFGQCVVWSQLNYEARNQLLTWPLTKYDRE